MEPYEVKAILSPIPVVSSAELSRAEHARRAAEVFRLFDIDATATPTTVNFNDFSEPDGSLVDALSELLLRRFPQD